MNAPLKTLVRISAVLAFVFCLGGGLWILSAVGFERNDDTEIWTAIGLYFIGKAFFVGPMLLVAAEQLGKGSETG